MSLDTELFQQMQKCFAEDHRPVLQFNHCFRLVLGFGVSTAVLEGSLDSLGTTVLPDSAGHFGHFFCGGDSDIGRCCRY